MLLDEQHAVQTLFHVKAVPASFLYNRSGALVAERFRNTEEIHQALAGLGLGPSAPPLARPHARR